MRMKKSRKKTIRRLAFGMSAVVAGSVVFTQLTGTAGPASVGAATPQGGDLRNQAGHDQSGRDHLGRATADLQSQPQMQRKATPAEFTSNVVSKLNDLEGQEKWADIRKAVLDNAQTIPAGDRDAVIAWLELRVAHGNFPGAYALARQYAVIGELKQAAKWYVTAGLLARIDATRFDSPTINVDAAVKPYFGEVIAALSEPSLRAKCMEEALAEELFLADRPVATWLSPNASTKLVDDSVWRERRAAMRERLTTR